MEAAGFLVPHPINDLRRYRRLTGGLSRKGPEDVRQHLADDGVATRPDAACIEVEVTIPGDEPRPERERMG
jgi:hypothetical protein